MARFAGRTHLQRGPVIVAFLASAIFLYACSSGGGTPPFGSPPSSPVSGLPSHVAFTTANGSGYVTLPAAISAPAGDTVYATASITPPLGIPVLPTTGGAASIFYLSVGFSKPTNFAGQPGISFTLTGGTIDPTKGPIYLAELLPGATIWQQPFAGPAETFTGNAQILISTGTTIYPGGTPIVFALYQTVNPVFPVVLSPSSINLTTTGQTATVSASALQYSGTFTATSQNPGTATVTPSTGSTFTITAVAAGSTQVYVSDTLGATTALPVSVTFAPIAVSPSSVNLTQIGQTQTVTASATGYPGIISAVSANPGVATVTSTGGGSFSVQAVSMGSTSVKLSDTDGTTTTVPVNIAFAPIVLSPSTTSFTQVGQSQTITATVAGYSGTISATSNNTAIATVTAIGGGKFTVQAVDSGSAGIKFSDANGTTATLPVSITFAPIVLTPTTQAFTAVGQTQTISATVAGYSGTINAVSNNTSIATVSALGGGQFSLHAVAVGSTNIAFSDANGTTANLPVSITLTGGGVVVPGPPWTITALGTGSFTAAPFGIVVGPDRNLWFTEPTTDNFGYMTTSGSVTEYPFTLPAGSQPTAIATGSDGNLYIAESGANAIAVSSKYGFIITQPAVSCTPVALSLASTGAMWAAVLPNLLCPVSLTGVGTCVTTPSSGLAGLANGPDGRLWFAQTATNTLAAMTLPGHSFSTYPIPSANAGVTAITAGSDGNLWFTESNVNKIARITTSGTVTEFTTPITGGSPSTLTAGPDGNVYAIDATHNDLIRITTSGTMTVISLGTITPQMLTAGPDGNLYITQATPAAISQVIP